jgi:hypothetical protein
LVQPSSYCSLAQSILATEMAKETRIVRYSDISEYFQSERRPLFIVS